MHCVTNIHEDLYWLGGSDRQLAKFENVFPIPRGVSYNAYLVLDEKTVLLDTVDKAVGERFFENLEFALAGRPLDYVVVNHMEPDHCATLGELLRRWPGAQVVANAKTVPMVSQFFDCDISNRAVVVKEGDTLCTGRHTFTFLMAPMVHWPEVMVTYDAADKVLFSADAFGTFGALNGNIFADQVDFERDWLDDARRYYTNIVGKYGAQVQSLLKRAAGMEIQMICPPPRSHLAGESGVVPGEIPALEHLHPRRSGRGHLLRLHLRPHGERRGDPGRPLGREGRKEHLPVRRVPYGRVLPCQRGLPVQPSGAGFRYI